MKLCLMNWLKGKSIRSMVIWVCMPFFLLAIVISVVFYMSGMNQFSDLIRQNSIRLTIQATDTINRQFDSIIVSAKTSIWESYYFFTLENNLRKNRESLLSPKDYLRLYDTINNYYLQNRSEIQLVILKLSNNNITIVAKPDTSYFMLNDPDYDQMLDEYGEEMNWITKEKASTFINGGISVPQVGIIKMVGSQESAVQGYLYIGIKDEVLLSELTNYKVTPSSTFTIAYDDQLLFYDYEDYHLNTLLEIKDSIVFDDNSIDTVAAEHSIHNAVNGYVIRSPMSREPFTVVAVIPMDEMYVDTGNYRRIIITEVLLILCIFFCLFLIISKLVSSPAEQLVIQLSKRSDLSALTPIRNTGGKEFMAIEKAVNEMLQRIQTLVEALTEEMHSRKNAELSALYSQINPHFLYNTLDSIRQLCEMEELDSAKDMLKELSDFYRIGVSKGGNIISMREELQHVTAYLSILHTRYEDFNYEIDIPANLMEYRLPKIILQPIVENALYHGIRPSLMHGILRVRCLEKGDYLKILVDDNGVGMEPSVVEALKNMLAGDEISIAAAQSSYGLRNVNLRLKLEFGARYGLEIESEVDEGTTVTLLLPGANVMNGGVL